MSIIDKLATVDTKILLLGSFFILVILLYLSITKLMNPLLFISGFVLSIIIIYKMNSTYIPYFLPELTILKDKQTSSIISGRTYKTDKTLIQGVLPLSTSEITYITNDKTSDQYVNIPPSVNVDGGAQYTFTFWLNKKASPNYKNKAILLKGQMNPADASGTRKVDIKSPLIKFGNNSEELEIHFNTLNNKDNKVVVNSDVFKVTAGDAWFLITIIIKDYKDPEENGRANGVQVLVFLNDSLIDSGSVIKGDALKLNNSPMYILPKINNDDYTNLSGRISDLIYHNYALNQEQITNILNKGPTTSAYKTALQIDDIPSGNMKIFGLGIPNKTLRFGG